MLILLFSSAALGEHIRGEGQGSDADVVTRSGGDADLDMSQPEMESRQIKVEIDMAVDSFSIQNIESQSYSKLFIIMQKTDFLFLVVKAVVPLYISNIEVMK